MFKYNPAIIFLTIVFTYPGWANDAVEAAATGNVVFEKTPELIIQDETLSINKSASKKLGEEKISIDVDFHFKNTSDHDVTRKIAFVLPPVQCRMEQNSTWRGLDFHDSDRIHDMGLKDFSMTVDDRPQSFTTRKEAFLGQHNMTALLTKLKIPLNPCHVLATLDGKPNAKYRVHLKKHHLLTQANDAAWSENIYFEWTQTFPAGKVIHIHHHYTPVIGESVLSPRTLAELKSEYFQSSPVTKPIWSRNPETLANLKPSIGVINNELDAGRPQQRFCVMPKWVEYHLTTGALWNGGIGSFKLVIKDESGTPFAVNDFYSQDNAVHTSMQGNAMTFTLKNFIPKQALRVLFLSLPQRSEDFDACGIKVNLPTSAG